jgi:hypothetical protein
MSKHIQDLGQFCLHRLSWQLSHLSVAKVAEAFSNPRFPPQKAESLSLNADRPVQSA